MSSGFAAAGQAVASLQNAIMQHKTTFKDEAVAVADTASSVLQQLQGKVRQYMVFTCRLRHYDV